MPQLRDGRLARERPVAALVAGVVLVVLTAACGGGSGGGGPRRVPAGVQTFRVVSHDHLPGPITYDHTPPVGGAHSPTWQNCGFYDRPITAETAVHSMEHGAVWITHRPELAQPEIDALRQLARDEAYVLVSPWTGELPSPVVASAWGRQLRLDSANDPRLAQFVRVFAQGSQAPEPGAPCEGGVGEPQ